MRSAPLAGADLALLNPGGQVAPPLISSFPIPGKTFQAPCREHFKVFRRKPTTAGASPKGDSLLTPVTNAYNNTYINSI